MLMIQNPGYAIKFQVSLKEHLCILEIYAKKLTYFEVCDQEKFYGAQALTTDKHRRERDAKREKITSGPIKSNKNVYLRIIPF